MDRDILIMHGIDYDDGVKRLLGNSMIFEKCLLKFHNDESFARLKQELESGNCEEAFKAAHNLKGVAANLSMTHLSSSAGACCEELRAGNIVNAKALFPAVEKEFNEVITALQTA